MPRHYGYRRALATRPKRKKIWIRGSHILTPDSPTLSFHDLLADFRTLFGINVNLPGFTLGPFHFRISVRIDLPGFVTYNGDEGIQVGVIIDDIGASGAGGPPRPNTDPGVDWIWNEFYSLWRDVTGPVVFNSAAVNIITPEINTKSMRKIEEIGQTCYICIVPTGGAELASVDVQWNIMARLP